MCSTMAVADEMEGTEKGEAKKKWIENPVNVFAGEGIKLEYNKSKRNKEEEGHEEAKKFFLALVYKKRSRIANQG